MEPVPRQSGVYISSRNGPKTILDSVHINKKALQRNEDKVAILQHL